MVTGLKEEKKMCFMQFRDRQLKILIRRLLWIRGLREKDIVEDKICEAMINWLRVSEKNVKIQVMN